MFIVWVNIKKIIKYLLLNKHICLIADKLIKEQETRKSISNL